MVMPEIVLHHSWGDKTRTTQVLSVALQLLTGKQGHKNVMAFRKGLRSRKRHPGSHGKESR